MDVAQLSANMKAPGILSLPSPADCHLKDLIEWQPAIPAQLVELNDQKDNRQLTFSFVYIMHLRGMYSSGSSHVLWHHTGHNDVHEMSFKSICLSFKIYFRARTSFFYTVCYTVNEVTYWQGSKLWVYTHSTKTFYGSKCLWNHPLSWPVSPGFCRHFVIVITRICDQVHDSAIFFKINKWKIEEK